MALKPTIYKFKIALSDMNAHQYESYDLTIALHPSENIERMMVRVLAFCLNASEGLTFTKGLSDTDEPDLWQHSLDGNLELWVDVGEPSFDRIKKATNKAPLVKIYSFNTKSNTWWDIERAKVSQLKTKLYRFDWSQVVALAALVERTTNCSVTIDGESIYVAADLGECELTLETLQE